MICRGKVRKGETLGVRKQGNCKVSMLNWILVEIWKVSTPKLNRFIKKSKPCNFPSLTNAPLKLFPFSFLLFPDFSHYFLVNILHHRNWFMCITPKQRHILTSSGVSFVHMSCFKTANSTRLSLKLRSAQQAFRIRMNVSACWINPLRNFCLHVVRAPIVCHEFLAMLQKITIWRGVRGKIYMMSLCNYTFWCIT